MEPRLNFVTRVVADLARARRFYVDGLGWTAAFTGDDVLMIHVGQKLVLSLGPRRARAKRLARSREAGRCPSRSRTTSPLLRRSTPGFATTLGAMLRAPHAEQGLDEHAGHLVDATLHVGASFFTRGVRVDVVGLRGSGLARSRHFPDMG